MVCSYKGTQTWLGVTAGAAGAQSTNKCFIHMISTIHPPTHPWPLVITCLSRYQFNYRDVYNNFQESGRMDVDFAHGNIFNGSLHEVHLYRIQEGTGVLKESTNILKCTLCDYVHATDINVYVLPIKICCWKDDEHCRYILHKCWS